MKEELKEELRLFTKQFFEKLGEPAKSYFENQLNEIVDRYIPFDFIIEDGEFKVQMQRELDEVEELDLDE